MYQCIALMSACAFSRNPLQLMSLCCFPLQGEPLSLTVRDSGLEDPSINIEAFENTANFLISDIVACQSIVHVMDAVMISESAAELIQNGGNSAENNESEGGAERGSASAPDTSVCTTALESVQDIPALSALTDAIQRALLGTIFANPGFSATIFAPNNKAFQVLWSAL